MSHIKCMKTLYIIGNGFDLNLGMKTRYTDFQSYILNNDSGFYKKIEDVFIDSGKNGELWRSFEAELSHFNVVPFSILSENEVVGNVSIDKLYEMRINGLYEWKWKLDGLFKKWISDTFLFWILSRSIPEKNYSFSKSDVFLNFNYTTTLENYFNINPQKILHIHGALGDRDLIYGHGDEYDMNLFYKDLNIDSEGVLECTAAQLNDLIAIETLMMVFKKPVEKLVKQFSEWLKNQRNIACVCVLGHSLGQVDMPYFNEIFKIVPKSVLWKFSVFSESDKQRVDNFAKKYNISNYTTGTIDELCEENTVKSTEVSIRSLE